MSNDAPFRSKLAILGVEYVSLWLWDSNFLIAHGSIFKRSQEYYSHL